MRKSAKIVSAAIVAGVAAIGSTAFTATSTIDDSTAHVGAVAQTITGVTVQNVQYTINGSDETTSIAFHVTEDLLTTDTVTVTIEASSPADSDTTVCAHSDPGAGTNLVCTFAGPTYVANVDQLDIVVS